MTMRLLMEVQDLYSKKKDKIDLAVIWANKSGR